MSLSPSIDLGQEAIHSCACKSCASCRIAWASLAIAAMFSNIQDGIEHLQVGQVDVAALLWQTVFDLCELG